MSDTFWPEGVPAIMPPADRGEITELYARYAWGLDLADKEMLLSTFAEDGQFDHLWQGVASGHEAIMKSMDELWNRRQAWWYGRQHLFNHFVMDPRPEGARVRCFFQIIQFNVEYKNNFVFGIGTRDDRLVKRNGRWVFYKLHVNAWTAADQVPWKGDFMIDSRPPNPSPPADTRPFMEQAKDPW
ncbi:MAG: nuclear transport factor 2 family protein [Sphingomonas sp.]|nr:nuclear transport factor 2 family protein [Sphingomonas sp.]